MKSKTTKRLQKLIYGFTNGAVVNYKNFKTFTNSKGETLPIGWNTTCKIQRLPKFNPSPRIARLLLDYFNEPYYTKKKVVYLGVGKTKSDEVQKKSI